ncbi:MAG: immune inhibitor A [Chloroflexi bacterium]|nr:immune inhibitor A [Chloroflexota bacterium]
MPPRFSTVLPSLLLLALATACSGSDTPTPQTTSTPSATPATPTPGPTATLAPSPTPTVSPLSTPAPTATPTPSPTRTPTPAPWELDRSIPPDRDLYALARRLVLKSDAPIPRVVNPAPVSYTEGREDTFHVADILNLRTYSVTATLKVVSEHAYWYVDNRVNLDMDDLERAARIFEETVYPAVTGIFGTELIPGIDNDTHLTILHTPLRGVAGYFSSVDEYPLQVHRFSNQREMIYISTIGLSPGSDSYLGTLAHELTHAIQFRADSTEDTWVVEGLAEIGKTAAGYAPTFQGAFQAIPSVSLTLWSNRPGAAAPHYGGANLFFEYLAQHFGGYQSLRILNDLPARGIRGVQEYLEAMKTGKSFQEVFADWVVANYLDDPDGGPYSYPDLNFRVPPSAILDGSGSINSEVPQYAAKYIELRPDGPRMTVAFKGQEQTPLLPTELPDGGHCWWGNRGDTIDSTLTGRFRLPAGEDVRLTYSLWYSLEERWDYMYVEVSTDGGGTWDILEGSHTSSANPVGNSFGPGYTGRSDGWLDDQVDLTPYAGQEVLVRFEYVTDDALNGPGVCIDNIAIPAIGFLDDAERETGVWETFGFIRTENAVPQGYVLRVIEVGNTERRVRDIALDQRREATFTVEGFGSDLVFAVVVVAGLADRTTLPATFELRAIADGG